MEQRIITVYCLIEDYLKAIGIKDDVRAVVSNAEVLLVGYMAVSDFAGNYRKADVISHQGLCMMLMQHINFYHNCHLGYI
jgi:hypothetical protein